MGVGDGELGILLINNARMRALNRSYRGQDRPTDVLSFSAREGSFGDLESGLLGDVVISLESVHRQAAAGKHRADEEVLLLLIHGILHLLGHDHERSPADARRMRRHERRLRRLLPRNVFLLASSPARRVKGSL